MSTRSKRNRAMYSSEWFLSLKKSERLFYLYVRDCCDSAGFIEFDLPDVVQEATAACGSDVLLLEDSSPLFSDESPLQLGWLNDDDPVVWVEQHIKEQVGGCVLRASCRYHVKLKERIDEMSEAFPAVSMYSIEGKPPKQKRPKKKKLTKRDKEAVEAAAPVHLTEDELSALDKPQGSVSESTVSIGEEVVASEPEQDAPDVAPDVAPEPPVDTEQLPPPPRDPIDISGQKRDPLFDRLWNSPLTGISYAAWLELKRSYPMADIPSAVTSAITCAKMEPYPVTSPAGYLRQFMSASDKERGHDRSAEKPNTDDNRFNEEVE